MPNYEIDHAIPLQNNYLQDVYRPIINKNKLKYPGTNPAEIIKIEHGRFPGKQVRMTAVSMGITKDVVSADDSCRGLVRYFARVGPSQVIASPDLWGAGESGRTGYILDINTNRIIRKYSYGSNHRFGCSIFQTINEKFVTVGAFVGASSVSSPFIYDISSDKWKTGPEIPGVSNFLSCIPRIYNNKIWLFGYITTTAGWVNRIWCYDIDANRWYDKGEFTGGSGTNFIRQASYNSMNFNTVYFHYDVYASRNIIKYNFDTGEISSFDTGIDPSYRNILNLGRGRIFITPGSDSTGDPIRDAYIIDMYGETVTRTTDVPIGGEPIRIFKYGNKVCLFGTYSPNYELQSHYQIYNVDSDSWESGGFGIGAPDEGFWYTPTWWAVVVMDNKLYLFDPTMFNGIEIRSKRGTHILNLDDLSTAEGASLNIGNGENWSLSVGEYDIGEKYGNNGLCAEFDNKIILGGTESYDGINRVYALPKIITFDGHSVWDYQTMIHDLMK